MGNLVHTRGRLPEDSRIGAEDQRRRTGFILVREGENFGFAAGMDGKRRTLSQSHFKTSHTVVDDVVKSGSAVFMVEGLDNRYKEQASIVAMNLRAMAGLPLMGIPSQADTPVILGILYLDSTKKMHSLSGLDEKILNKLAMEAGNILERVEMIKSIAGAEDARTGTDTSRRDSTQFVASDCASSSKPQPARILQTDAVRRWRLL